METYKNSYSVHEDQALWELHEIRHELHEEQQTMSLAERNKGARELFEQWKNPSCRIIGLHANPLSLEQRLAQFDPARQQEA